MLKCTKAGYPFLFRSQLPQASMWLWADPQAENPGWYTTSMIPEAKNHCAAVMAANLALYLSLHAGNGVPAGLLGNVYARIGNGPVLRGASAAVRALAREGLRVKPYPCLSRQAIRRTLEKGMPCALLLTASVKDWHWVLCVGMVTAAQQSFFAVADGWHTVTRYLPCGGRSCLFTAAGFAPVYS